MNVRFTTTKTRPHAARWLAAALTIAGVACDTPEGSPVETSALLEAPTPSSDRVIGAAVEAFRAEREVMDPSEAWAARVRHHANAEEALRRGSIDDGSLMNAVVELRAAFFATPEADEDFGASEEARIARYESIAPTAADLELERELRASSDEAAQLMAAQAELAHRRAADDIARMEAYEGDPRGAMDFSEVLRTGSFAALGEDPHSGGTVEVPVVRADESTTEEDAHAE